MSDFQGLVRGYHQRATGDKYARLRGWEYLWDHIQSVKTWQELASPEHLEKTALHLGFYLANWGMFRGSSGLLNVNLDFFKNLTTRLFSEIDTDVWNLWLDDFAQADSDEVKAFDHALLSIKSFEPSYVSWTETLITKLLLGFWGECPARDQYFNKGFSSFLNGRGYGRQPSTSGRYLVYLNQMRVSEGWSFPTINTKEGNEYPTGKLIDMAFFQMGAPP